MTEPYTDGERKAAEKIYQENPEHLALTKGFFRMGNGSRPRKVNVLYFPVKIIAGRRSFGRVQCLITPFLQSESIRLESTLGKRWVDRKFMILPHDYDYKLYEKYFQEEGE